MARTVRDTNLESRAARLRLPANHKPYWRLIDQGAHLGYRKGRQGGAWKARFLLGEGRYGETTLGIADDVQDADGATILSFQQAQAKARTWFALQARQKTGEGHVGDYTVADAWADYLKWFGLHRRSLASLRASSEKLVLTAFGSRRLDELTTGRIRSWHESLATSPPRLRTGRGKEPKFRDVSGDADAPRRRKATANRHLTCLKAALNLAWRAGKVASDDAWRRVKPFHNVEAPRIRYLSIPESRRLVNACDDDFRRLVQGALLTGCRYGELTRLTPADYSADSQSVHIRVGKSGKPRHVYLTDEGVRFFATLVAGKVGGDILFVQQSGDVWGKSEAFRPMRDACTKAKIVPAISFHILRHTYASQLVMAGVPLQVLAQNLGHSDTRMTERHYAHLAPSYVADTIRNLAPRLRLARPSNVHPLVAKSTKSPAKNTAKANS